MLKCRLMLSVWFLMFFGMGCTEQQVRPGNRVNSPSLQEATDPVAKRFQEGTSHSQTVVQSAVELSEKYSALSEEAANLRQARHELEDENAELKRRIEDLENKLSQCNEELDDANALLMDVLTELNEWKSQILGYRQEMRDSAKAQLRALIKILELMGADVEELLPTEKDQVTSNEN
jgi:chromosome segregation ATPase